MLVCLSAFYCLKNLNRLGVYPDEYYTDYLKFKSRVISLTDATVLVIIAGTCGFNKTHAIEFIKSLMKRADDEKDKGIKELYVVTDSSIPSLNRYYKFQGTLSSKVSMFQGWNLKMSNVDIWAKLRGIEKESMKYLSDYDRGDSSVAREAYESRQSYEDNYIKLIKVADVKKMLGIS